jgi:hypothetical protein
MTEHSVVCKHLLHELLHVEVGHVRLAVLVVALPLLRVCMEPLRSLQRNTPNATLVTKKKN